jgi:transposase
MIYERVKTSSVENICREEGLDWEEVQSIFKELAKLLDQKIWNCPKRISMDEFAQKKGKKSYITTDIPQVGGGKIIIFPKRA